MVKKKEEKVVEKVVKIDDSNDPRHSSNLEKNLTDTHDVGDATNVEANLKDTNI